MENQGPLSLILKAVPQNKILFSPDICTEICPRLGLDDVDDWLTAQLSE